MPGTSTTTLEAAGSGAAIALDPTMVLVILGLLVVGILGRIGWVLAQGRPTETGATEGAAAH